VSCKVLHCAQCVVPRVIKRGSVVRRHVDGLEFRGWRCGVVCCSMLHRVAVCCSMLQCVQVSCSVLHLEFSRTDHLRVTGGAAAAKTSRRVLQGVAGCCNVLHLELSRGHLLRGGMPMVVCHWRCCCCEDELQCVAV